MLEEALTDKPAAALIAEVAAVLAPSTARYQHLGRHFICHVWAVCTAHALDLKKKEPHKHAGVAYEPVSMLFKCPDRWANESVYSAIRHETGRALVRRSPRAPEITWRLSRPLPPVPRNPPAECLLMTLTGEHLGVEMVACRPLGSNNGLLECPRLPDPRAVELERSLCQEPSMLVPLGRLMDYDTASRHHRTFPPLWAAVLEPSEQVGLLEHL